MAWTNKLNGKYSLETLNSKESIVNTLKERIDKAQKDKSWFSFEDVDYKNMRIDDYRIIIKRKPALVSFMPNPDNGFIIVHFNQINNEKMQVNAEIKPYKIGLWLAIGVLIPFSALQLLMMHGVYKYGLLIISWSLVLSVAYLGVLFFRYRLKMYLETVLADIGIKGDLIRERK
ncbi:hypothetical protein JN11_01311 [Mucilaginibacter frigoritolerans]|jgi:hypothetical protein|uniref:Uncharacterized protein n=1 Tax=Mucilaginibacter frigoritolerans TaxID=652788 RepID=A0A562U9W2_9SPHI|nr:hypothetical protein [Mucilaginibacter frigoritolerans]TWJ02339.1 hypothetical protein JN11_01311 [Mucilaginibacter frigoritolerans]